MEYVEGLPIDQYCDLHKLSINDRLRLFREVCSAVQYAHEKLVIHRDLKPGNILIAKGGVPRLLDFGIAKLLNPECVQTALVTRTDWRPMTPEYASPEQIRGQGVSTATDVYSLGVLLFELLTGHRPYRSAGRSLLEMERLVSETEPEKPSAVINRTEEKLSHDGDTRTAITPESVSKQRGLQPAELQRRLRGDLDTIITKALRKEPVRRYTSVQEFSQDIERHLAGLPVTARRSTATYRAGKVLRRHKESVAAVVTVLALVAAVGTWETNRRSRQQAKSLTEEDTMVLADFANSTGDGVFDDTLKTGLSVSLRQSPFLNVLSDSKVASTLQRMTRPASTKLTPEVARELCQRASSKAYIAGSIGSLGSEYVLGLKAVNCQTETRWPRSRRQRRPKKRCWTCWAKRHRSCAANWANRWRRCRSLMYRSTRQPRLRSKLCERSPWAERHWRKKESSQPCLTINAPSNSIRILPWATIPWATTTTASPS